MSASMLRPPLAALALAAPFLALGGCGSNSSPEPAPSPTVYESDAAAAATDWTAQNPTEPAVPVTLPTTRMTNESVIATGAP